MKKICLAVVFTFIAALNTWAIPLPPEVTGTFTGSFVSTTYGINTPVSGTITFKSSDYEVPGFNYLHHTSWWLAGSTDDGALSFTGNFNNDMYAGIAADRGWDESIWYWWNWERALYLNETLTGSPNRFSSDFQWTHGGVGFEGNPWDLTTNENFLPVSGVFDLYNRSQDDAQLTLNFQVDDGTSPAPVPEPATILLLGSGLAGLAAWRKKQR